MKKQLIVLIFIGLNLNISLKAITSQQKQQQNRGDLIVGKGEASTELVADNIILHNLASQIMMSN